MTNKPELTGGRTIGSRIATLLAADSVPLSDAWKALIDAADAGQAELQELRRSYLAHRGEIEDVQAQLYEAENRNEADAAELQERRKADSAEPVFFIEVEGDDWIQAGRIPGSTFDFNNLPDGINRLYAAPPAPVVPENCVTAEHRRVIEMLLNVCGAAFELADDSCQQDVDGEECHVVPDDAFQKLSDALDEIENTLPTEDIDRPEVFLAWSAMPRAALKSILQAGNSPELPDGWIPVSERMPDEIGRYWCYVEEQNSLGKSHYQWNCSWNGERWWIESDNGGRVTHWMPLPAAPQQEVKHG